MLKPMSGVSPPDDLTSGVDIGEQPGLDRMIPSTRKGIKPATKGQQHDQDVQLVQRLLLGNEWPY